jgi:predicted Holliday junction resolvase-like endonuclease
MSFLEDLRRQRRLFIVCPNCEEEFPASHAQFFDATKPLPPHALERLRTMREQLQEQRSEFKKRVEKAWQRSEVAAKSVNIGKVVEKIAPSLRGFPARSEDCRSLFEPIDYLVFRGLAAKGLVEAIDFVDVKSGGARLTGQQSAIRSLVERGRVSLHLARRRAADGGEGSP